MIADAMTKALPTPKHRYCFDTAGLLSTSGSVERHDLRSENENQDDLDPFNQITNTVTRLSNVTV